MGVIHGYFNKERDMEEMLSDISSCGQNRNK